MVVVLQDEGHSAERLESPLGSPLEILLDQSMRFSLHAAAGECPARDNLLRRADTFLCRRYSLSLGS